MNADVSGIWEGTAHTDNALAFAIINAYGVPRQTLGTPIERDLIYRVTLSIASQGEYQEFSDGWVSVVAGQLKEYLYDIYTSPVSGFIDDKGLVKLTFYSSFQDDTAWTFNGRLTDHGRMLEISGDWTKTRKSSPWVTYYFGTLSVHTWGWNFRERAYLVPRFSPDF